ncbi:hypothetical protein SDC9_151333 [bioreactor metagenome]|uniref:Uncharacterized protein n=1 Tax=bioreactor metagenome TaxID=1076179 RepID=A0A645EQJ2_9ZZZZ
MFPEHRKLPENARRFQPIAILLPAAPDGDVFGRDAGNASVQSVFPVGNADVAQSGGGHQPALPVAQPAFSCRFAARSGGPGDRRTEHQRNPPERAVGEVHAAVRRDGERQPGTVPEGDDPVAPPVALFQRQQPGVGQLRHSARVLRACLEIVAFHCGSLLVMLRLSGYSIAENR